MRTSSRKTPGSRVDDIVDSTEAMQKAGVVADAARASNGVTNLRYLTALPRQIVDELGKIAGELTGNARLSKELDDALQTLATPGAKLSARNAASDTVFDIVSKRLLPRGKDWNPETIRAASKEYGPEILLFFPVYADSYRRHIDQTGGAAGTGAKSFEEFLEGLGNRDLQRHALAFLDSGLGIARRIKAGGSAILSAGSRRPRSTHAQRLKVLDSLRKLVDEFGEDVVFEIWLGKSRHLIPDGQERRIMDELLDYVHGRRKLPEDMTKGLSSKEFLQNDLWGFYGMAGETVSLADRAADAAKLVKDGRPVYLLSGIRADTRRLTPSKADNELLEKLPDRLKASVDDSEIADTLEASVVAQAKKSTAKESNDGVTAFFDGPDTGGFETAKVTETKMSSVGVHTGRDQIAEAGEVIEVRTAVRVASVVEVTVDAAGNPKVRALSLEEARKASGAQIVTVTDAKGRPIKKNGKPVQMLEFHEDPKIIEKIDKLDEDMAKQGANIPALAAEQTKLLNQRQIRNFNKADKEVFVGDEFKQIYETELAARPRAPDGAPPTEYRGHIDVRGIGHSRAAVADTMYYLMFLTGLVRK